MMSSMRILQKIGSENISSPLSRCFYGEVCITTSELYRRARMLAATLQQYGIAPGHEQRVLLCLPRTPSLVIAHLAVFFAGGVIVPVDHVSPAARLLDIVGDAEPDIALVASDLHADLFAPHCHVIKIDERLYDEADVDQNFAAHSNNLFPFHRAENEAAYIIYTSGTTGKPKGVVVELQALEALLQWHLQAFELTSNDCVSLTASPGFDASIWEIWGTLGANASMYICTDDERLDPTCLQRIWLVNKVTHAFVSTPLLERLLDLDWSLPALRLRFILTGGDRLTRRPSPGLPFRLINNYGPSEGCVVATSGPVAAQTEQNAAIPPDIGYPLPHMQTYVLDDALRPVPRGQKGNLWIGGVALARGYLNREDLTSERFLWHAEWGVRMYDTGDIVSENEDGSLCYHGRNDTQVKIDGVRIELSEVESVMCTHPRVRQAVAVVVTHPVTQTSRLACSIVLRGDCSLEELRVYAEERLPHAMVPSTFLIHQSIPLTANGKIDRASIIQAQQENLLVEHAQYLATYACSEIPEELKALLNIWTAVLGQPVTPQSDLFALGGNSIAAAQIAARIAKRFNKNCKASHVLANSTPVELAAILPSLSALGAIQERATVSGVQDWFPVTSMQQSLWYLWKTNPQNPFYNIGATFVIDCYLDEKTLCDALLTILSKHGMLYTRFRQNPESQEIEQRIEPFSREELLSRIEFCPPAKDLADAMAQAQRNYRRPFDLERDTLFRGLYLPIRDGQSIFMLVGHHSVIDGLSLQLLLRELAACYTELLAKQSRSFPQFSPATKSRFAQFVTWQHRGSQEPAARRFWQEKVQEMKPCEFPKDGADSATFEGKILECRSQPGLGRQLVAFCREQNVSSFVTMLAAWFVTVAQFCHQNEITVGVPFHGRTHPSFDNEVGMFVNLIPLSLSLQAQQHYSALVKKLAEELSQAMEHGNFSLGAIAALTHKRESGATELVNTPFSEKLMIDFPLPYTRSTFIEMDTGRARFALSAFLHVQDDRIEGHIEYASPAFAEETIKGLMETYFAFLAQAIQCPLKPWERCLPEGPVLMAEPTLVAHAQTRALPLHKLFEHAAEQYANMPALQTETTVWTYKDVDSRANQLAIALHELGVQQGDLVPLVMERSAYMVAAILAVLKLGAVYVPIDPEYPLERCAQILLNLNVNVVIIGTKESLPEGNWQVCCAAEVMQEQSSTAQCAFPPVAVTDAAYLLFTSGSTGTPKGVLCPHLGAALRVQWQSDERLLYPGERVLFKTPYTFDVSVWEIFYPLSVGATLVIAPPGLQRDPSALAALIAREKIQLCHFVPTMLQLFLEAIEGMKDADFSQWRVLHTSGEALPPHLIERVSTLLPHVRLLNLYGPTETGIEVTGFDTFKEQITRVSIGHPLPYVSLVIAGPDGRPVPEGFPGELLIGGPSLALEYFHNAEETARKFIMRESGSGNGPERFYKTGDLVRQWHDGTLDFLGRTDEQMKVRGVRIEPGEIEAHIVAMEGIQEAVVVAAQAASGIATLVCFYVPGSLSGRAQEAVESQAQHLKQALAQKLPPALVPALFYALPALPLTSSGKRDRKSLSKKASELLRIYGDAKGREPQSPMELRIARIWCQVLKQTKVGVDQNFFESGGDSVKTLQIGNLLLKEGLELAPRDFFLYPTIEEQARYLEAVHALAAKDEPPTSSADQRTLPLTPLQSLMLIDTLRNPCSDAYWQVIAYRVPATIPALKVKEAWQATVDANPALRTRVVWNSAQSGQVIEQSKTVDLNVYDWRVEAKKGQRLEEWCQSQAEELKAHDMRVLQKVLYVEHWSAGPEAGEGAAFVWIHHHILVDGWSMTQCLNDFFSYLHDGNVQLSPRPSLEAYFSWLEYAEVDEQAQQFWKQELAGVQPAETLHFAKPAAGQERGEEHADFRTNDLMFSSLAAQMLAAFCQRHRLTASSVITCLWGLILHQYQNSDDICVGMTFANRPYQLDCVQELSGMLINTLPIRLRLAPQTRFIEQCRQVLNSIMSIAEHTVTPYSTLLACTQLPGMAELFKSTLVFQNFQGSIDNTLNADGVVAWQPELLFARGTSTDPLALTFDVRDTSIALRMGWDEQLYAEQTVTALVRSLNYWLEHIFTIEQTCLAELALVTPEERNVLARTLAQHASSADTTTLWCLGSYLKAATSTAIAAYDGYRSLSYAELKCRALRLASYLAYAHNVRRGDTVAYVGKRSVEAVIALSATWLLGAAWCALDADFPEERQNRTLQVLKPKAVITLTSIYALTNEDILPVNDALCDTIMTREQIAYYLSTSGSTGYPKLVALAAGGLPQVIAAWKDYYELAACPQRVLQIGSWTSDVFLGDFLKALSTGGTLVICPDDRRIDLAYLAQLLEAWQITLVESTPALITSLLKHLTGAATRPEQLRTVIVGSDIFRLEELNALCAMLWSGVRLYNGYGLSECMIESLVLPCTSAATYSSRSGLCPLGAPLPGTSLKIVDHWGRDLPPGAIGELLIGGEQVAKGYLMDDGHISDDRIIVREHTRYFKTGDLARLNERGYVEFFGRRDTQIKIRGHRIELGEIENALLRQAGIRETVVLAVQRAEGLALVAFAGGAVNADVTDIQKQLHYVLPEYAVPQHFIVLPALPRNANGKIDRVLLQERLLAESESYIAPTPALAINKDSPLQQVLLDLWQSVLHRPVNPQRSFFDQGGHSLLVLQLFGKMKERLPDDTFEIADLFLYPSIEAQAAELLARRKAQKQPRGNATKGAERPQSAQKQELLALLHKLQRKEISPDQALVQLISVSSSGSR